jgi:hypothetical protein
VTQKRIWRGIVTTRLEDGSWRTAVVEVPDVAVEKYRSAPESPRSTLDSVRDRVVSFFMRPQILTERFVR